MKTTPTFKSLPHSFLMSVVLCLFGVFFTSQAYAQHEELLDKTWYLYKLEIDGEEYEYYSLDILTDNDESRLEFDIYDKSITGILFDGCPGWGVTLNIEFIESVSKFITGGLGYLPFEYCQYGYYDDNYATIEDYFYSFYQYGSIIEYSFETIDTIEYLIFTNENNNKLYYTAENLSIADFEELGFSIYPNPTQDWLHIHLEELSNNTSLEVYDVQGKL
ncbi:MAG TPA: hypothetical protein VK050_00990, partial [Flavobacteriaceae bacterium]|nr:hypothetical protein [Flavobacteriaceae bacterium]